ncbi:MAG: FAD-dependent oxidoreductase [Pseudomonadota bacterium]|nr:FAD-dependent oxidoreductase [Pseudomonadota bacterium]
MNEAMFDWVVVGGGSAGLASVLALTGRLPQCDPVDGSILLLDAGSLGHGTSLNNPGRGQGGFHYPDIATAEHLQDLLVHNLTVYPDRFASHISRLDDGEIGRSWYALLPHEPYRPDIPRSIVSEDASRRLFEHLAARWNQLRRVNPALEVLGTSPFMEWVGPDRAKMVTGTTMYDRVAVTLEPGLDVPAFMAALEEDVKGESRVTILEHDRLTHIERLTKPAGDGARFVLETVHEDDVYRVRGRNVNICAWEDTEELLTPLGFEFDTLNRIKRGFHVRLDPSSRDFPSTIAVYGSHAMFRNLYDGTGFTTIADLTNVNTHRLRDTEAEFSDYVAHRHHVDEETLKAQVHEVLNRYFPALEVREVADVVYGCVKIFSRTGRIDLNDPHSEHNRRAVQGFARQLEPGLWITWAMKLVSCFVAAEAFHAEVMAARA